MKFLNLTNGIEFLNKEENYSFIRIQSTTIERKNWVKLFSDLDHNLLLHLAIGTECEICDCGTNRKFSKTLYYGVPLIEYCLNRYWYGIDSIPYRFTRNCLTKLRTNEFISIYEDIFLKNWSKEKEKVRIKLKYYKKFLNANRINIKVNGKSTDMDGKYSFYKEYLLSNMRREI